MNKQEFRETEIGRIPRDWGIKRIGDLIELFENGIWGNNPIEGIESYPVIRSTEITHGGKIGYFNIAYRVIPKDKINKYRLKNGDILIVGSSGSPNLIGRVAFFKSLDNKNTYLFSNFLIRLRARDINSEFLYYFLCSTRYYRLLQCMQQTSTGLRNLPKKEFIKIKLSIPPLLEQKKIAEILSTVDENIEETDESIKKTERLKKSLMQELFTNGIGHKEFKETATGKIPIEWEIVRLGDKSIIEIRGNKTTNRFDRSAFIPMEFISESNLFVKYEMRLRKEVKSSTYCECGDLLLAKITPSLENGKQGIVPQGIPNGFALTTTEVFPILCKGIEKTFLFYLLKFSRFRNKIIFSMTGTTGRQRASKKSIENLLIPLPPLPEQKEIVEILSTVDERIQLLKEKKSRLNRVKKGLMNDLLTGRRRVEVGA